MKYLIDSHIFLWLLFEPNRLITEVRSVIENPANQIFVSSLTFWELSLKFGLGKLSLEGVTPQELPALAEKMGLTLLDLGSQTAASVHQLPMIHKDPFDRMLINTAIQQNLILISRDRFFEGYQAYGLVGLKG